MLRVLRCILVCGFVAVAFPSLGLGQPTQADLAVTKTDSPDPVDAGADLTYAIEVTNNGPSDAQAVVLTDAIPTNTTFVSAIQNSGPAFTLVTPPVGGTGTVTATVLTLAAGATATFSLVVNVNAGTAIGTMITNTATVASTTPDPDPANDTASTTTLVGTQADLAVTKTDSPDPVDAGADLTYAIEVTNNGPSDAQAVVLTDAIPANTTFVSAMQNSGPAFTLVTPPVGGTGTVTATVLTLAAGATATFTVIVNVNAGTAVGTMITNTATVASTTADPDPANNTASATTLVGPLADLAVTKTDSPDPVDAGADLTYAIEVTNNGPSDAQAVVLTDAIPANTTFVSAIQNSGPAFTLVTPPVGGTGTVTATVLTLAAGATATFTVIVNVNAGTAIGTMITNTATVSSTTTDPDPSNDSDTVTTAVGGPGPAPTPTLSLWGFGIALLLLLGVAMSRLRFRAGLVRGNSGTAPRRHWLLSGRSDDVCQ